jgi:hypothetical protein
LPQGLNIVDEMTHGWLECFLGTVAGSAGAEDAGAKVVFKEQWIEPSDERFNLQVPFLAVKNFYVTTGIQISSFASGSSIR